MAAHASFQMPSPRCDRAPSASRPTPYQPVFLTPASALSL